MVKKIRLMDVIGLCILVFMIAGAFMLVRATLGPMVEVREFEIHEIPTPAPPGEKI